MREKKQKEKEYNLRTIVEAEKEEERRLARVEKGNLEEERFVNSSKSFIPGCGVGGALTGIRSFPHIS